MLPETTSCFSVAIVLSASLFTLASGAYAQEIVYPDAALVDPLNPLVDDRLGTEVRVHGEFILATAPADTPIGRICPGSVFVYRQSASGYDFVQRISALERGDCLTAGTARRIEVCGDYLFIGVRGLTVESAAEGIVRVLRRTSGGYVPTQVLLSPPGMQAVELFGAAIESDGERVYITSPQRNVAGVEMGAMFIYRNDGGTWVLDEWFENVAFEPGRSYPFRRGFAVEENRIVATTSFFGALLYEREPSGWQWKSAFPRGANRYTSQIDIDDGWMVVGDADTDVGAFAGSSYVRVFRWDGVQYELVQTLQPSFVSRVPIVGDQFGYYVDIRGEELLIGARGRARNGVGLVGGAYLFELESGVWVEKKLFLPPESAPEVDLHLGSSVAIADGAYLVGAELMEVNGVQSGGVYVYERPFGEPLCEGRPNSTGTSAELEVYGNSSAAAEALELRASGLPASTFSLFITGQSAAQTPMLGGGEGTLCIAPQGIRRLGLSQASGSGTASWQVDFNVLPGSPTAGETYHFQTWYRDATPTPTSNLTSAVTVTLE